MPTSEPVSFIASIPPIDTAIKIHGQEGARLVLDVADTELGNFFPITLLRGMILRVTIEAEKPCKGKHGIRKDTDSERI